MKFIPNAAFEREMLKELNLSSIDDLFTDIPSSVQIKNLDLDEGLSQQETEKKLRRLANKNKSCQNMISFLGGGIKPHYIPAAVKSIQHRSEFFTAYTPYQSEASQGFLQAMFEYQSMIAELTGMDIANCSLYDGITAIGEAALMATRITKKSVFLIPSNLSWEKKSVLNNYVKGPGITVKEISFDEKTGKLNKSSLDDLLSDKVSGVYIENPNTFGIFESHIEQLIKKIHEYNALSVVGTDPFSLGIVKSPGEYDADITIGEGRGLGNAMNFGGSGLGLFACKQKFIRQIPGRLIGLTKDSNGNDAFCMSLQTREQHIRRGKATSNICTNEGLCALGTAAYLSWLGGNNLVEISKTNFERGQSLSKSITEVNGFSKPFTGTHFNEFVIKSPIDPVSLNNKLINHGIQGGLPLERWFPTMKNMMLFGITEIYDEKDIKQFISVLEEVIA
ncbi:MAG TPA: aminomethyl-transferring glycine dehydrogenase subunit GcvPA [Candidatus Thermoplasmatota archaeon]|nr:aminomethyl-transferring glycine dehydrogenase subunit GcvPA [Candidatus Thermoplasmatota archaeon]